MKKLKKEIRASYIESFFNCPRYFYYFINDYPQEYSEYTKRAFYDGKIQEQSIIESYLEGGGNLISRNTEKREDIKNFTLKGEVDALVETDEGIVIVDAKLLSTRTIFNILNSGVPHKYYYQMLAYLYLFRDLNPTKAVLYMRDKDTPRSLLYRHYKKEVYFDKKNFDAMVAKIDELIKTVTEGSLPNVEPFWMCTPTYCPYYSACGNKNSTENTITDEEFFEKVALYQMLVEESKGYETEKKKLREEIVTYMQERGIEKANVCGLLVELKPVYRVVYDVEQLDEETKEKIKQMKEYYVLSVKEG